MLNARDHWFCLLVVWPTTLLLCLTLCLPPLVVAQSIDETALHTLTDKFFVAYQKEDVNSLRLLWSAKSPELATFTQQAQATFAVGEKIEVKSISVRKIAIEGATATARVAVEMNATDAKTGRPVETLGKLNRTLHCVKEDGEWKVWRYAVSEEELASALIAAQSDQERNALLEIEKELQTVELRKALSRQGDQLRLQGKYPQMKSVYRVVQQVAERTGDQEGIGVALLGIGVSYRVQSDYTQALNYLQKALAKFGEIDDKSGIAKALLNIGNVHFLQGNQAQALEYYRKSLSLCETLGDKLGIARASNNLGNIYINQANFALALESYLKALAHYEALDDKEGIGIALFNVGHAHAAQQNHAQALEYYQKSLLLSQTIGDKAGIVSALNNMGTVYKARGEHARAVEYFQKAIPLRQELGDQVGLAGTMGNLCDVHYARGEFANALDCLRKTLERFETIGSKQEIITTLVSIALIHNVQGDYTKAVEFAERANADATRLGNSDWRARTTAGKAYHALGQPDKARQYFADAIDAIEKVRHQLAGGERAQLSFFEDKFAPYLAMVELLVATNQHHNALEYAERAKARLLLGVLNNGQLDIAKAMTAEEREQERKLGNELVLLNSQVSRESLRPQPDAARLSDLKARLEQARLKFEDFQIRLYVAHPELKVQRGEAQPVSLKEAGALLPDTKSALLEYVVTDDQSFLFVLTKEQQGSATSDLVLKVYPLNIKQKDLAARAREFHRRLADRDAAYRDPSRSLYDLLLKPARGQLRGKTTLIIVPDGALWELPFQALLSAENRHLIEDHAISYAPSLTVLREMIKARSKGQGEEAAPATLLAFGNPALGKTTVERVKLARRDEGLEPLPEAEQEVKALGRLYGAGRSQVSTGAQASEDLLKTKAGSYRILHLATHAILNDTSPMYSHVLLSQAGANSNEDGLLEAWEIMNLNLQADMVVLSACETARGRIGAGEGVIGLTWALFVAGAPTTVVSQWKVESASTTELMMEFHRQLQAKRQDGKPRATKAEALRQASFKLMRQPRARHPFYWAAFVVVGDGE